MSSDGAIAIAGKGEIRESEVQLADEPQVRIRVVTRKLKVFLSSTGLDLTAFRRAVHARLVTNPLFECIRQEEFFAQPNPPVTVCHEQVLRADLFVGLIGMRRGWEPPDDPGRRSITEMEYDWAKDVAPRFMHVTTTKFPVPGDLPESTEERQRHLAFRTRLMTELVVSQDGFLSEEGIPTPDVLARLIVDQLTHHVLEKDDLIDRIRPPRAAEPQPNLPDVIAEAVQVLQQRGVLKVAEQGGLERDIVLKLARRINPDDTLDFDRAVAELENAITIALDVIARGKRGSNEDNFVNDVLKRVGALTQVGENERAVKALDDALKELDVREAEHLEASKRSRLTLLQAGIEQDILRRNAASAARRAEQSAALHDAKDFTSQFESLRATRAKFYIEGRDKGINFSLEIAIEIARRTINLARNSDQRGIALNDLGAALRVLGDRESGIARLNDAVAAYREALKERTRERAPLEWAMTQSNLGNALTTLGERESGTARLDEAVAAYREAFKERMRERAPLQWAMTQNNLGTALRILGERESGTARLEEAAATYRGALKEYTRERAPLDWAMTQNNLGAALTALGERESGTARLEEAVATYREALKEWTRERVPLDWATTQNNLGAALTTLGERESGTARLDEAVAAFREALMERTRERVPLDWAATQYNLGDALTALGQRESGTARLDEAVAAYREALKEWTRERVPLDWAMSTGNHGVALMRLADRRDDATMATSAVNQIEQALAMMRDAGMPHAHYYETRLQAAHAIRDRLQKT